MAHKCPMCRKEVTTNSIQCSVCELWIHKACTGMSGDLFKLLVEMKEQGQDHSWKCEPCGSARKIIEQRLTNLEKTVNKLQETVASNTETISTNKAAIEKVEKRMDKIEETVNNIQAANKDDSTASVFKELRERENKKLNIIIHNLMEPDPSLTTGEEKKKADYDLVTAVLKEIDCSINPEVDIKFSTRLGKINESGGKPRPLLIGLTKAETRSEVLEKIRACHRKPENFISIVPDLTVQQRKEEDDLRLEADKLNEKLSGDDFLVWEWKVLGSKGEKRLVKVKKRDEMIHRGDHTTRGQGRGRGRNKGHNRDQIPRSVSTKRKTRSGMDTEEEEEEVDNPNPSKRQVEAEPSKEP